MARQMHRLSSKSVEKNRHTGYYCDGAGLYLQVSPTLSKSWIFRYTRNGKSREMGLGSKRDVTLAEARAKAAEQRRLLVQGLDPIVAKADLTAQERLKSAGMISFADCAKRYIAAHSAAWRNPKHAGQWQNTLDTYAGPVIGQLPVRDIDTGLVLRVLEPIWAKKPETASRLRGRVERILDYAKVRGYRGGENPARWRGHLDKLLPASLNRKNRKHHAALPYDEIANFLRDLREQKGTAARALEFTILNVPRTDAAIRAKPAEFDLKKGVWTIPVDRMLKSNREHRVPLARRSIEIVEAELEARPDAEYIFSGAKYGAPLSNMAMLELLKRMGREDLTVHGFRSTFRDWAAECTNYPNEVCEMALAHTISNEVEAAYRRGDLFEKRRRLMLDWAAYCDRRRLRSISADMAARTKAA